jgi:hypothetical protein
MSICDVIDETRKFTHSLNFGTKMRLVRGNENYYHPDRTQEY